MIISMRDEMPFLGYTHNYNYIVVSSDYRFRGDANGSFSGFAAAGEPGCSRSLLRPCGRVYLGVPGGVGQHYALYRGVVGCRAG